MPRIRPDDFRELKGRTSKQHPWARWWRHRDGTVTHVHYHPDGTVLSAWRHDTPDAFPASYDDEPVAAQQTGDDR